MWIVLLSLEDDEQVQLPDDVIPATFDESHYRFSDTNKLRMTLADFNLLKVLGKGSFGKVCSGIVIVYRFSFVKFKFRYRLACSLIFNR